MGRLPTLPITDAQLAALIDHSLLRPTASEAEIAKACEECGQFSFKGLAVNPCYVRFAAGLLEGSGVLVGAAVGFPSGATTLEGKVREAGEAVANGAGEIDMVANLGALKSGRGEPVEDEIAQVVRVAQVPVKVILETCYLTCTEKVVLCRLAQRAGAAFVKTSTGFGSAGAMVEDVRLMRETVGQAMGVKAAGGIRDLDTALAMIQAGANRLGTSASVQLIEELRGRMSPRS